MKFLIKIKYIKKIIKVIFFIFLVYIFFIFINNNFFGNKFLFLINKKNNIKNNDFNIDKALEKLNKIETKLKDPKFDFLDDKKTKELLKELEKITQKKINTPKSKNFIDRDIDKDKRNDFNIYIFIVSIILTFMILMGIILIIKTLKNKPKKPPKNSYQKYIDKYHKRN